MEPSRVFIVILGIFVAIASDATHNYHVAIVGFLAAGIILTSSSANNIMYTSNSAREAAAAGFGCIAHVSAPEKWTGRRACEVSLESTFHQASLRRWPRAGEAFVSKSSRGERL